MENLFSNSGYHFILQEIFLNLNFKTLKQCCLVNKSWNNFFSNPHFWFKICKNQKLFDLNAGDWLELFNMPMDSRVQKSLCSLFKKRLILTLFDKNLDQLKKKLLDSGLFPVYINNGITPVAFIYRDIMTEGEECYNPKYWYSRAIQRISGLNNDQEMPLILAVLLQEPILTKFILKSFKEGSMSSDGQNKIIALVESCSKLDQTLEGMHHQAQILNISDSVDNQRIYEIVRIFANILENPNKTNSNGRTIMINAVENGHTEIVKILAPICENFDQTLYSYKTSPLHLAISDRYIEMAKTLIPYSKVDQNNSSGFTPLHYAAMKGLNEIVEILAPLYKNPHPLDLNRNTPMHYAAENGHLEVVKTLTTFTNYPDPSSGTDYGSRTVFKVTPMHKAAKMGHVEIVKFLATLCENPNLPDNEGKTPLHLAARNGHTDVVKVIVSLVKRANPADQLGSTPLHEAAKNGHVEIVKILLAMNINPDPSPKDVFDKTPLDYATDERVENLIMQRVSKRIGFITSETCNEMPRKFQKFY